MYDFGMTLKELRKKKGMTQKRLAALLDVSEGTISRYESNQVCPSFETMRSISAILGVSIDDLYGTEQRFTISTTGLSEEQKTILAHLADTFSAMNNNALRHVSEERYALLGHIVAELIRQ